MLTIELTSREVYLILEAIKDELLTISGAIVYCAKSGDDALQRLHMQDQSEYDRLEARIRALDAQQN